jgi:uncharacterized protein YijF (DUF1287 family)
VKKPSTKAKKAMRKAGRQAAAPMPASRAAKAPVAKAPAAKFPGSKAPRSKALRSQAARRVAASHHATPLPVAPVPVPAAAVLIDERKPFLLLLAPVLVLTIAVGVTQTLGPKEALRRQIAALPPFPTLSATVDLPEIAASPPKAAAPLVGAPAIRVASNLGPDAKLGAEPPPTTIAALPAPYRRLGKCYAPRAGAKRAQSVPIAATSPSAFGLLLAHAAVVQTADLVVYSDKYRQIGFPMGDVPALYGVCADVVVRAYRTLGIDLQELVHKAALGTGDPSIDQRRVQTLRRFFTRYGVSLAVTDFVEDYRPGDIVTYHSDFGRTSQSHIAIVADVIAPSGRPMIVHNRGWGPQLEDALFARDITGHYRFTSMPPPGQAETPAPAPAAGRRAEQSPGPASEPQVRLSSNRAR